MAINPLARLSNFDVPNFPLSAARADPSVFSNLASIGEDIGQGVERKDIGRLLASATDAQGNLDLNKAATAIALSGRDPARYLAALTAEKSQASLDAARRDLAAYHAGTLKQGEEGLKFKREEALRPDVQYDPGSVLRQPGVITIPRTPGSPPSFQPLPDRTPGPQSALDVPGSPVAAAELDPENAPPYQVAGPPMPPPSAPATVAPAAPVVAPAGPAAAPAVPRNDAFLQRFPPAGQVLIKGVANYDIDPQTLGKDREEIVAAAKTYRPDYSMNEYQKRNSPPSGEIAARMGLAKAFLERVPAINKRIQADELNSAEGRGMAMLGQGGPGELRRAIDEGAEALLRGLTGAGMSQNEATNYQRRYQFSPVFDTKETQFRKLGELENALRYVTTEVGKGRGGDDLMKDYRSKFGEPTPGQEKTAPAAPKRVVNDAQANRLIGYANNALAAGTHTYEFLVEDLRQRGVPNPEAVLRKP